MVEAVRRWYRSRSEHPYIRPWGLSGPILVLIVCLPLLRPLRYRVDTSDPKAVRLDISDNERARLATVQAIVEGRTLALDQSSLYRTSQAPGEGIEERRARLPYSSQPPVLAALLAGPYWVLQRVGLGFDEDFAIVAYVLTLLGSTLPVALAAGLVYRLGRLFELPRPWRATLAVAAVFGSGLLSYATVLNSHAPAAMLVLGSFGSLIHATTARVRGHAYAWLALAGFCAALAAVIDLGAIMFLLLLGAVILAIAWPVGSRLMGLGWYALGSLPPIVLHIALTLPVTGDLCPGLLHTQLSQSDTPAAKALSTLDEDDDEEEAPSLAGVALGHVTDGLLGSHGLLTHFPVLLIGLAGIGIVLRRHWPMPTKGLALVSLGAGMLIVLAYAVSGPDWQQPMFAVRWFVVFLPLLMFWAGAWLRRPHRPAAWSAAAALLAFSILTTLIGATAPFTQARPGEYTAYAAARQLVKGTPASTISMVTPRR